MLRLPLHPESAIVPASSKNNKKLACVAQIRDEGDSHFTERNPYLIVCFITALCVKNLPSNQTEWCAVGEHQEDVERKPRSRSQRRYPEIPPNIVALHSN